MHLLYCILEYNLRFSPIYYLEALTVVPRAFFKIDLVLFCSLATEFVYCFLFNKSRH